MSRWESTAAGSAKFSQAGHTRGDLYQTVLEQASFPSLVEMSPKSIFVGVAQNQPVISFVKTPQFKDSRATQIPDPIAFFTSPGRPRMFRRRQAERPQPPNLARRGPSGLSACRTQLANQ